MEARDLTRAYVVSRGRSVHALRGVSLDLAHGETLAIVGESGCGKSTLARILVGLEKPNSGTIRFPNHGNEKVIVPMVFQDSLGSLHPRRKVAQLIVEPLLIRQKRFRMTAELREKAKELARSVGIAEEHLERYAHELSGGQRQRVNIARALSLDPEILLLDEPLSALDVSIQAQILNLLIDLQERRRISIVFISHDLSIVRHFAHRTAVLYMGAVVEYGETSKILTDPLHPYTKILLSSDPSVPKSERLRFEGEPPSPFEIQQGCSFAPRCPIAETACQSEIPHLEALNQRAVACLPAVRSLKTSHGNAPSLS